MVRAVLLLRHRALETLQIGAITGIGGLDHIAVPFRSRLGRRRTSAVPSALRSELVERHPADLAVEIGLVRTLRRVGRPVEMVDAAQQRIGIGRSTPASIELARHVGEENPAMRILGAALRWLSGRFSHSPTDPVRTIVGDVDLCLVADGAERQLDAASKFTDAIWHIAPCPPFTMIPISPTRLAEKTALRDHFFGTVLQEGVTLATEH